MWGRDFRDQTRPYCSEFHLKRSMALISITSSGTFTKSSSFFHPILFTQNTSIYQLQVTQFHLVFTIIQSSGHFSKMLLVHWMVAIPTVHPLHQNVHFKTTRVLFPKTVFSHVPLISSLSIRSQAGKDIHFVTSSLFRTKEYATILLNGAEQALGEFLQFLVGSLTKFEAYKSTGAL
jgi:hypothetical protein